MSPPVYALAATTMLPVVDAASCGPRAAAQHKRRRWMLPAPSCATVPPPLAARCRRRRARRWCPAAVSTLRKPQLRLRDCSRRANPSRASGSVHPCPLAHPLLLTCRTPTCTVEWVGAHTEQGGGIHTWQLAPPRQRRSVGTSRGANPRGKGVLGIASCKGVTGAFPL